MQERCGSTLSRKSTGETVSNSRSTDLGYTLGTWDPLAWKLPEELQVTVSRNDLEER